VYERDDVDGEVYLRHLISQFEDQEQCFVDEAIYCEFTGLMQYALITIGNINNYVNNYNNKASYYFIIINIIFVFSSCVKK
jgi:hypothetical protein